MPSFLDDVDWVRARALGRKLLRFALIGAAGLAGVAIIAVVGLLIALQITPVRSALGAYGVDTLARGDGITLELEGYGGLWPVRLSVDTLRVRDGGALIAEAHEVDVSWAPWALLGGTAHVRRLAAEHVVVHALPKSDETDDAPLGPLIPSLPVDVQLDGLEMPEIRLAAGVVGDAPVTLSMRGSAALVDGDVSADLSAARTDGGLFDLSLTADVQPVRGVAAFDVSLKDGAPGVPGLISAITGNADLAVVSATASAQGPEDDWSAVARIEAGELGTFDLSLAGDRSADGVVALKTSLVRGAALAGLPSPVEITGKISRDDDAYLVTDLNAGLGDAGFAGEMRIADPMGQPHVQVSGRAVNLASIAGLALPDVITVDADVTADGGLAQLDVAHVTVQADGLDISFTGGVDLDASTMRGDLTLGADDVATVASLAGVDAAGALTVTARIASLDFAGVLDGEVAAEFRPVRLPVAGLADILGDAVALKGRFAALELARGTRIEELTVTPQSGLFSMSARGDASAGKVDLHAEVQADDATPFSSLAGTQLSGAMALAAHLKGPVDSLALASSVTVSAATVSGVAVDGAARADLDLAGGVAGPVSFVGRVADADADLTARLDARDEGVRIDDISARLLDMSIAGNAAVAANGALTAKLKGNVTSLRALGQMAGTSLEGSGTFQVESVSGETGGRLTGKATLRRVGVSGVQMRRIDVTGGLSPAGKLSAKVDVQRIAAGNLSVVAGRLTIDGDPDTLDLTAGLTGISTFVDQDGTGRLDLAGRLDVADPALLVSRLEGVLAGTPVRLAAPVAVALRNGVRVEDFEVLLGEGRIGLEAVQRPGTLDVETQIENVPLALLIALSGQTSEARGTLSGDLTLKAKGGSGSGAATLKIAPVTLASLAAGTVSDAPVFLIDADWDGRVASARMTADMPGTEDLIATASLPVRARNGLPQMVQGASLDARLDGTLDLGAVWPLVPVDGHIMTGLVAMDMTARGPFADMEISGTAQLRDGSYEGLETGLILTPLNVGLVTQGGKGDITVETRDGSTGTLDGTGLFDLREEAQDRLRVALDMTSFRVLGRDDLSAVASGDISVLWPRGVDGKATPLTVGGEMTIERLEAQIPDQLASDVETIEVTRVSADGTPIDTDDGTKGAEDQPVQDEAAIGLALSIKVPQAAFVRGRGLESEWAGNLDVAGSVTAPRLQGAFEVQRGTFDFLGQTFDLAGGRIEFSGGDEVDPYLDIKAVYEDDDFQAIVTVTGLSSDPTLQMSSVPVLPQDEILARILFGTGTGQLTAFQAVQLADAAATLAGASTGGGVLDTMRRALGVDVLSVGESGLEVGSYVRDGVYLGVSQGLDAGTGEVTVEVELTDDVSIESDVGTTGDTSVGVTWGRDY